MWNGIVTSLASAHGRSYVKCLYHTRFCLLFFIWQPQSIRHHKWLPDDFWTKGDAVSEILQYSWQHHFGMSNSATVFCKEKTRAFYPDSINMEKKFPQMPVSIPSMWKTILKDSLKLTISAPDQIHFWNPIQYLQEPYGLHRMGFLAAISRMWSE